MKNKLTKKEAAKRKADWNKAIREGRVVRFLGMSTFVCYPTIEARDAALAKMESDTFNIVEGTT
jgi:hypothetical protein